MLREGNERESLVSFSLATLLYFICAFKGIINLHLHAILTIDTISNDGSIFRLLLQKK